MSITGSMRQVKKRRKRNNYLLRQHDVDTSNSWLASDNQLLNSRIHFNKSLIMLVSTSRLKTIITS